MVFLWGILSMLAPVLALTSGGLVAAAIVARDLSTILSTRARVELVAAGGIGYIASGGIAFAVDAALRTPLISYCFVSAVFASSLMVGAALVRWAVGIPTKLSSSDQMSLQSERISS